MLDFEDNNNICLSKSAYATQRTKDTALFGSNIRNVVEIDLKDNFLCSLLEDLSDGIAFSNIKEKYPENIEIAKEIIKHLFHKGLIEKDAIKLESDMDRFDRQILFFKDSLDISMEQAVALQKRIMSTNVSVLGIGGVGSYVVRTLSAMGYGVITVLDFDQVEVSNLSRQIFYDYRDIGKQKVDVIEEKIPHISPSTKVVKFNKKVQELTDLEDVLAGVDVCVASLDTPRVKINEIVARIPFVFDMPTVYGGSVTNNVMYGPTVKKGKSSCFMCVRNLHEHIPPEDAAPVVQKIGSRYTTSLIDPINTMAASVMALEVTKLVTDLPSPMFNKSVMMTLDNYNVSQFRKSEGAHCEICGS